MWARGPGALNKVIDLLFACERNFKPRPTTPAKEVQRLWSRVLISLVSVQWGSRLSSSIKSVYYVIQVHTTRKALVAQAACYNLTVQIKSVLDLSLRTFFLKQ